MIRVRQGVPVELVFDRQESGECTNRGVFPALRVSAGLPAHQRTAVGLRSERAGSYGFACGMNMIHGTLVVDAGENAAAADEAPPAMETAPEDRTSADDAEAVEVAERPAEITDLGRRGALGTVLTLPVLFAMMADEVFGADWVPDWMLNH